MFDKYNLGELSDLAVVYLRIILLMYIGVALRRHLKMNATIPKSVR